MSQRKETEGDGRQLSPEQAAAAAMVAEAKARGLELTDRISLCGGILIGSRALTPHSRLMPHAA
ncbi:hypothetical protein ACFY36_20420 [Actinoplanes sp. NPDC000266]